MNLPWVSRTVYDVVVSQNGRLWVKLATMVDRQQYNLLVTERDGYRHQLVSMVPQQALDLALSERDRLREQNAELLTHLKGIDRVEHGLPEQPRKPPEEIGPQPREMREHMKGWPKATRDRQNKLIKQRRLAGESYDTIWADIQTKGQQNG